METSRQPTLWIEVRNIFDRAGQVMRLIPRQRKYALAGASGLLVVTSAGNTAVALLLGWLIDRIQKGLERQVSPGALYTTAFEILGTIAAIYLVREVINVYRRYLVESSCTAINRDMQIRLVETSAERRTESPFARQGRHAARQDLS